MLKVSENNVVMGQIQLAPIDAEALAVLREIAIAALTLPREGEIHRFGPDRADVEIVLGFRPNIDRVVISGSARVLSCEDAGSVVLTDASRRRIVLHGLRLADLAAGDVVTA